MTKYLLIVWMIFGLAGCTPNLLTRYEVVERRVMVMSEVDSALLEPCAEPSPPVVNLYTQANRDRKEALLTEYISDLQISTKRCSLDKFTLKSMITRQAELVKKFNDEEAARVNKITKEKTGSSKDE